MSQSQLYLDAWLQTILQGVHEDNFKGGTFVNSITKSTNPVDAMNILLSSPKLSTLQKQIVSTCLNDYNSFSKHVADGLKNVNQAFLFLAPNLIKMGEMFQCDAKPRDNQATAMRVHTVSKDGKTTESVSITESGKIVKDGVVVGENYGDFMRASEWAKSEESKTDSKTVTPKGSEDKKPMKADGPGFEKKFQKDFEKDFGKDSESAFL